MNDTGDTESSDYRYPQGRILVFTKAPLAGQVKTRLAATIGGDHAVQLHEYLLEQTLETAASGMLAPVELWVPSHQEHPFIQSLPDRYALTIHRQQGQDLGERMLNAFTDCLARADFCILIGSDCPSLDKVYLEKACELLLNGRDIVIGPAEDGGYVLIGLRTLKQQLFTSVHWSTELVLQQTRDIIESRRWDCEELARLWDIDRPEDLQRWLNHAGCETLEELLATAVATRQLRGRMYESKQGR